MAGSAHNAVPDPSPASSEGTTTSTAVAQPPTTAGHGILPSTSADESTTSASSGTTVISVSTTFYPGARDDPLPTDLVLVSSDSVFFYVHSHTLRRASSNSFSSILSSHPLSPDPIPVSDPSHVLNVLLHIAYDLPCDHYAPSLTTLSSVLQAVPRYGLPPIQDSPRSPLYPLLLSHAPHCPLDLYALASSHSLESLAVSASSYLLSIPLSSITDPLANQMGPSYLRRLFFLHLGRLDALKRLLLPPPTSHAPTPPCDFVEQKKLSRAWVLTTAYLIWDATADISTAALEASLCPLADRLWCDLCKEALSLRVKQLVTDWSKIKRTI